ncbi:MAG TPA: TOBE domain-containing protein [Methanocorpusculum sp.]|nr:TOBE domain-containing protein [Methanocorpusculum sp.]HJJ54082.1 TOBE domain-containing protein [Methanocorpusculum sp.]
MKLSARNQIKGKVVKITHGMVSSEIVIDIGGGQQIVSVITKTSADSLGLAVGKEVYAVIKSSEVMIAVN